MEWVDDSFLQVGHVLSITLNFLLDFDHHVHLATSRQIGGKRV